MDRGHRAVSRAVSGGSGKSDHNAAGAGSIAIRYTCIANSSSITIRYIATGADGHADWEPRAVHDADGHAVTVTATVAVTVTVCTAGSKPDANHGN